MYGMNYVGKFISNFRDFYNEINAATLTGAIDVIVVQQQDGSYTCSPFHVRFGKLGVLRSREKVVDIEINGEPSEIQMKLGDAGEAFFVEEVGLSGSPVDSEIPPHLACSPIPHDDCFHNNSGKNNKSFQILSELPFDQHNKILRDSVMSIEREKWEQMSALPHDQRQKFLLQQFPDLPPEQRDNWLQIANLTFEEKDKIFNDYCNSISTAHKQQFIRDQYSALKTEDKEKLFKENFPELPRDQRLNFERALLNDWKSTDDRPAAINQENKGTLDEEISLEDDDVDEDDESEEIFDMEGLDDGKVSKNSQNPKSFVAVTSSDRIRKVSVIKNDFRPIRQNLSGDDKENKLPKKTLVDESGTEGENRQSAGGKKRRKKKSVMRRKNTPRKISSTASSLESTITTSPDRETTIEITDHSHPDILPENQSVPVNKNLDKIALSTATDFHFFSDSEVTKGESRPSSPIQSDTEFEVQKITQEKSEENSDKGQSQSWRWGELPDSSTSNGIADVADPNTETAEARRSMLGGMFSFMRKTSRIRHNPESEGIYLSDLNADELDPEVAALYFPSSYRSQNLAKVGVEEDAESGNGPSLPQSPNSVEGAIGGPKSLDSDFDDGTKLCTYDLNIRLSLCGGLDLSCPTSEQSDPTDEMFQRHIVRYEEICADPKIYENPNLVVRINGKYYNWQTACPIVMTHASFQRPLPQDVVSSIYDEKKRLKSSESRSGYSSWFSWRRSQPKETSPSSTKVDDNSMTSDNGEANILADKIDGGNSVAIEPSENKLDELKSGEITPSKEMTESILQPEPGEAVVETEKPQVPITDIVIEELKDLNIFSEPKDDDYNAGGEDSDDEKLKVASIPIPILSLGEKYRKTLRLSSEQISNLDLKEGVNEVVFSVTTAYQGTSRCKCHIYKWRWDDKIVISDIDGTITKSDVLGHILPVIGKDWAQSGVAQLFTKIKNNGYKLLYLSARAIGQAKVTREYLRSIKQDDLSLPDGPLLLNPTSLISALHREVIEKKPEEFKISCLSDIQALFPEGSQPFYAGYGNRINDVWAYRAVGIPITRIFTINHRGELKHELTQTFQSSYLNMTFIADHLFPAIREDAADEFSNFSYWREPIAELQLNLQDPEAQSS